MSGALAVQATMFLLLIMLANGILGWGVHVRPS